MAEPLSNLPPASRRKLLAKSVSPGSPAGLNALGIATVVKNDPVLRYLAMSDEREYEKMIQTDTAIAGAVEQRITFQLAAGSEVVEGSSHSSAAKFLKEWSIAFLKGIPKFNTLWRETLRAIFYGWRPVELLWDAELRFEGRPYLRVAQAIARKPWQFQVTDDGSLVWLGESGVQPQVFDFFDPGERLRWMICTAGSTESPYGEAFLRRLWMLFFLSKKFEKMSADAMQRSLGILKAKFTGSVVGQSSGVAAAGDVRKVEQEVSDLLRVLNAHNVLIEQAGLTTEFLKDVTFADSYGKILELLDGRKRIAIVGQNLTSEVSEGSFAAAKVHAGVLADFAKSDAREVSSWFNDGLLQPAIELNHGEVDPEDLPKWRSRLFSQVDRDGARMLFDMGAPISAAGLADQWNVPLIMGEAEEGDLILRKREAPAPAPFPFFEPPMPPQDDPNGQRRPASARSAAEPEQRAESLNRKIGIPGEAARELSEYYRAFADQLAAFNDPKA